MVNILGFDVPIGDGAGAAPAVSILGDVTVWIIIVLTIMVLGFAGFMLWMARLYKYRVVVYENVSGQGFQRTFVDRARMIKLGHLGEEVLWLRKKKVYRSGYGRKMARNEYWFCVGQDGYWYNVVLGDLDAKMGTLDIEPVDRDMRYMHVAIAKNIQDRYRKKSQEKATIILMGGFIILGLILVIGGWYMLDKIGELTAASTQSLNAATLVQTASRETVQAIGNACTPNKGGLIPG